MYLECRHILTSGSKCRSVALRGRAYCYFHFNAHVQRHIAQSSRYLSYTPDLQLPLLEDPAAIQVAINEVFQAIALNRVDSKRAANLLYALQLACNNAKHAAKFIAKDPVRQLHYNPEGEPIGPVVPVYEEGDEVPPEGAESDLTAFDEFDGCPGEAHDAETSAANPGEDGLPAASADEPSSPEPPPNPTSIQRLAACLDDKDPDVLRLAIRDFVTDLRARRRIDPANLLKTLNLSVSSLE